MSPRLSGRFRAVAGTVGLGLALTAALAGCYTRLAPGPGPSPPPEWETYWFEASDVWLSYTHATYAAGVDKRITEIAFSGWFVRCREYVLREHVRGSCDPPRLLSTWEADHIAAALHGLDVEGGVTYGDTPATLVWPSTSRSLTYRKAPAASLIRVGLRSRGVPPEISDAVAAIHTATNGMERPAGY